MSNEMLLIGNIVGAILQSIFISYFIITVKEINNKRILFTFSIIVSFLLLQCIQSIERTVNLNLILGITIFFLLKIIYSSKARITDFIIYIIANIILGISSVIFALVIGMNIYGLLLSIIIPIILTHKFRHKLIEIDRFFNKFWNRHTDKQMFKSITIRGFSTIITIIIFVIMNFWLIYGIFMVRR